MFTSEYPIQSFFATLLIAINVFVSLLSKDSIILSKDGNSFHMTKFMRLLLKKSDEHTTLTNRVPGQIDRTFPN